MPPLPQRIALLFGGVSPEHEVSILSGSQVSAALTQLSARGATLHVETVFINKEGQWVWRTNNGAPLSTEEMQTAPKWDCQPDEYQVEILTFAQGLAQLSAHHIQTALLILHGQNGEDGRLQGALDLAGIPYTGSGAAASALCFDKPRTQAVLNAARLPIAPSLVMRQDQEIDAEQIIANIGLPCVIKPALGGSSVGISIVREAEELAAAIENAFLIDDCMMAEKFVPGREFTVGVIESSAPGGEPETIGLPVLEIIPPDGGFFTYDAKYHDEKTREICPAPIPEPLAARMRDLAVRAHQAAGCRGFSRVDILCDVATASEPIILEINTLPGMTARSLLPQAAAAAGIDYPALLALMLGSARHD